MSHPQSRASRAAHSNAPRWREHPLLGAFVRLLAVVLPVGAAVVTSILLGRTLPHTRGLGPAAGNAAILLVASGAVLFIVERAARRLIPLGLLLQLSMSFPDRAPSRVRVAHRAGSVRRLERHLAEARAAGVDDAPTQAAERIITLMASLAAHDRKTRGHSERVRVFSDLIADELRLSRGDRDRLRWAALLHDIGKLHLDAQILNKDGKPDAAEWEAIFRHPIEGARLAAPLAPWLGPWAAAIEQHHERYDGAGYPHRLSGKEISLGARIVGVADAYERMTSTASYKKPVSAAAAREELTRCAGTQFDPSVVRAFLHISIGKLWWRTGPLSFLAQVPLLAWLPRLAESAGPVGGSIAGIVGAGAGVVSVAVSGLVGAGPAATLVPPPAVASVAGNAANTAVVLGADLTRSELPSTTTTTTVAVPPEAAGPESGRGRGDTRIPVSSPSELSPPIGAPVILPLDPLPVGVVAVASSATAVPNVLGDADLLSSGPSASTSLTTAVTKTATTVVRSGTRLLH